MMVEVGSMRVLQILSDATNVIAEGEVQQLINTHDASLNEAGYLHVIRSKTAKLFEASAQLAAVLAGATPKWSKPAPPMARHWERHSRSSTMCSTTPATLRKWARTWAMTCAKANAPCP
jgi:hypothetical protein